MTVTRINLSEVVQATLNHGTDADVLYILDCCHASSIAIDGRRELLAACGIDRLTPGAGSAESFTRVLVEVLQSANGIPMTVAQLHGALISSYYKNNLATIPIHAELSEELARSGSIVLSPLVGTSTKSPLHLKGKQPFESPMAAPRVLLSVRLADVGSPPSAEVWKRWLTTNMPPGVQDVDVTLEGFFPTKSAMVLFMLPVVVWSVLRGNQAYEFMAFTRGPNLLAQSLERKVEGLEMQMAGLSTGKRSGQLQESIPPSSSSKRM